MMVYAGVADVFEWKRSQAIGGCSRSEIAAFYSCKEFEECGLVHSECTLPE